MFDENIIWVRGAGELGSAAAHILHNCGLQVVLSELLAPLAIRRRVTFSDAILEGSTIVKGVTAQYCQPEEINSLLSGDIIPLIEDSPTLFSILQPRIIVDAQMLKQGYQDDEYQGAFVVGLGPGFTAGKNCTVIIETQRGHNLGKIIRKGSAARDTGIPGELGGETSKRLIRAPSTGRIHWQVDFGDPVQENTIIGTVDDGQPVLAPLTGIIRGLISSEVAVKKGNKIGDVDPRGKIVDVNSISDKARSVGRGALEAILEFLKKSRT